MSSVRRMAHRISKRPEQGGHQTCEPVSPSNSMLHFCPKQDHKDFFRIYLKNNYEDFAAYRGIAERGGKAMLFLTSVCQRAINFLSIVCPRGQQKGEEEGEETEAAHVVEYSPGQAP